MARVNIVPNRRSGRCMLASTFAFPSSFSPPSDNASNPLHKELVCSQPASLVHLSAHAAQRSQKNTIKDVIHEMPKNLKEVLKMTDTSPRWKQLLSEDYSKTVEHWELPTLLALLNQIPTTLQKPMFINKNVRVESVENRASACGSTQMDVALTADGRHVHYRRRKIGAITEHLLDAEDGSSLIIASYSGSDESCFCHWIDNVTLRSKLAIAAGEYLAECDCRSLLDTRMQSGTVFARLGRDQDVFTSEWRGKLNFHSSTKFFYTFNDTDTAVSVGSFNPKAPHLDGRTKVSAIYIGLLPDTDAVFIGGEFGDQEAEIFIDTHVGHYRIRPRTGCMADACVDYVGSEVPILTSVDMPAEIDALYKHVRVGNWKAAAPLADKIVSVINSQLQ